MDKTVFWGNNAIYVAFFPMSAKRALITGITGQDGSYLAELLLEKGYEVHGIIRRSSSIAVTSRIDHLYQDPHTKGTRLFLHYGDLSDGSSLNRLLEKVTPQEIYHLGAQSHVRVSFETPEYTGDVTGLGTLRLLDAIRETEIPTRLYNAASSEMFGNSTSGMITETTHFQPRSPYACAKVYSFWMTVNYRDAYKLFASNGMLFNHESPRRGETFVTRKIVRGLARIQHGIEDALYLGNLDAKRDWGYAPEYVEGMWRMLQADVPDDYILATGETHSVREFAEEAAGFFGYDLEWQGTGTAETGTDRKSGKTIIRIDPHYFRPTEVDVLIGDASKAREKLGWTPKVTFRELVHIMAEAERNALQKA
jgi:GDPmannose 4,6-dehydratase